MSFAVSCFIIFVLVSAALAGAPALFNRYHHPAAPQQIEIVNPGGLSTAQEQQVSKAGQKPQQQQPANQPKQPSQGTPPPKPQGPPNRVIKEGQQPPTKR